MNKYDHEPWISTYTGRKVWPWNPHPENVEILDIAISLSRTARFRGHTKDFYSVAQHSVLASHLVSTPNALWALLHDAPEAYIGDLPKPLKQMLPHWEDADELLMAAICKRFHLAPEMPDEVKEIDLLLLVSEAEALLTHHVDDWHLKLGVSPDTSLILDPWSEPQSFSGFMERFQSLIMEGVP